MIKEIENVKNEILKYLLLFLLILQYSSLIILAKLARDAGKDDFSNHTAVVLSNVSFLIIDYKIHFLFNFSCIKRREF